jgi:hypothetical protein
MVIKKNIKPYIPLIFSLLLALVLFFIVEDFVKTVIVRPLLYVIWFFSLIVQSIPQAAIWIGFILLMLLFTYASLTKKKTSRLATRAQSLTRELSPIERWARLFENAQISSLSKWRLSQELKRSTKNILSPNMDAEDKKGDLTSLDLPAEISAFFEARQPSNKRLKAMIEETETALDLDPEVVIQYLEEQLRS